MLVQMAVAKSKEFHLSSRMPNELFDQLSFLKVAGPNGQLRINVQVRSLWKRALCTDKTPPAVTLLA